MKINIYSKTGTVTDAMQDYAQDKMSKLGKFLKEDEPVKITYEVVKKKVSLKVQVVLVSNRRIRCEVVGNDFYKALLKAVANLKGQAKATKEKNSRKERIEKPEHEVPEIEIPVVKKEKHFTLESITEAMAMIEMEKLGHETYLFRNINQEDKVCQLYKRIDGDYSMIVIDN